MYVRMAEFTQKHFLTVNAGSNADMPHPEDGPTPSLCLTL